MNFVVFYPDEVRAESLSCYGHPLVRTPNLDRLAAEGVRFDQCHVQHTVCTPSRSSLMTGWYPHVSGHRTLWHLLRPHEPSLFRYLKESGYHVVWLGKNDLYSPDYFPLAVDRYEWHLDRGRRESPYGRNEPERYSFRCDPFTGGPGDTGDMGNVRRAIDFLLHEAEERAPFVLYLPLQHGGHPPYCAPEPYHDMYGPDDLPPLRPADLPRKPDYHRLIRRYRRLDELPAGFMEKVQAIYLGMLTYVDSMLGEVLSALDESGLAEDTTVAVSSDHGDFAGDYGLVEKWPSALDDVLTRVPLLIRAPGNRAGHVVREPVEQFDLMATMLELAGVEPRHNHFARSLVPQLNGSPGDASRMVFAEGGYDTREPHCFEGRTSKYEYTEARLSVTRTPGHAYWPKGLQQQEHPESVSRSVMARTVDFKLVRRTTGVNELYDLRSDPLELSNGYGDDAYRGTRQEMEERLLDWYMGTSDVVPTHEDPRGPPPVDRGTGLGAPG